MDVKKVVVLIVVALVLFFLVSQPDQSAAFVKSVLGGLQNAAESLITFIQRLAG